MSYLIFGVFVYKVPVSYKSQLHKICRLFAETSRQMPQITPIFLKEIPIFYWVLRA